MKKAVSVSAVVLLFLITFLTFSQERHTAYTEPYRPQFHFSPEKNWINDPNGLVYYRGEYHLFFQYNPFGDLWGHMSWGHAVSRDLVHWQELPVALYEETDVMIYSGSAVVDWNNTTGFGRGGVPPMVAIYTGRRPDNQSQHIAYSTDQGRSWTKYESNPVIDIRSDSFRDPKVMWHRPSEQWIMAVALARKNVIQFYGSKDMKAWTFLSEFGPEGARGRAWECPDLYPIAVENEPETRKYVLEVGIGRGAPGGGSGCQYFVGTFDGKSFINDNPPETSLWVDYGADFYAAQSWSDIPESDGRRIMIAWMNNWPYARKLPTSPWRGQMSVPREVTLKRFPEGIRLTQAPVATSQALRTDHLRLDKLGIVKANSHLQGVEEWGDTLEIIAVFNPGSASEFGIEVRRGASQKTVVGYDVGKEELFVDRTNSGDDSFAEDFAGRHAGPLTVENGTVKLHLLVDRSSVEVFANGGRTTITDLIYPDPSAKELALYQAHGEAEVVSLDIWKLKSAW